MFSVFLDEEKINSFHIMKAEKSCSWTAITWLFNQAVSQKHFTFKAYIYSKVVMKFLNYSE